MTAPAVDAPKTTAPPRTLGPNYFGSVMGTGIVATAAASLPRHVPGLHTFATVVWALDSALLMVLIVAMVRRRTLHAGDPFWGAPPMALLTVGAGTLLLGRDWIGLQAAVTVDLVLWTAGTLLGLAVAVLVPYRMVTGPGVAFGGWLMPVVPPMVSAATGGLLVPHVAAGTELLVACYAMFGVSLVAAIAVITRIGARLRSHGPGPARLVPTVWIVLGPLGQSVTALHLLGAPDLIVVLYGVPVLGFAGAWAVLAAAITVRTARTGLPFALSWWSFTFPVGTLVTATSGLAARTGSAMVSEVAVLLYALLLAAWVVVAARTVHGVRRGNL